ncbi:MAG: exodeoxyribonuclease VII large subunit [Actinomycetales bacterium]|nr:MAG: exodeoxyribonuclease VII large subunit [Actinomycetales bacterium]
MSTPARLPEKAADTTAESPWPVRVLSLKIADYVHRMSPLWVEGQVVQLQRRANTAYLTLRDPEVDMSMSVTISVHALNALPTPLLEGARVVLQAKPTYWTRRGTLQLDARQIRPVGVGDLLVRIEILKQRLAAEGLFDSRRKKPLPFLPRLVGLVTGRASAAEHDVVENARRRWPTVRFEIRQVAVQGSHAVTEVVAALAELDAHPEVDVIVIARGGGALEELLPFSNETLLRAVDAAHTPVVSAVGHDVDTPLLDFVADRRASTPTDAGKAIVPDANGEAANTAALRARARRALASRLDTERRVLVAHYSRAVMTDPLALIAPHRQQIATLLKRATERLGTRLSHESDRIKHLGTQVRLLSPQSTLDRGYAVVTHADGRVVRGRDDVHPEELLRVLVSRGDFGVQVVGNDAVQADDLPRDHVGTETQP